MAYMAPKTLFVVIRAKRKGDKPLPVSKPSNKISFWHIYGAGLSQAV
jgi:hypothetical protein